ncbi:MAG: rod shape-determining protein MreC [Deltaproteobacteria bacterium]|nr:rod shape-determining protein MreC [Deltaproteobacteria bacterium]
MQGDKRFRNLWIFIFFGCFLLFLFSSRSVLKQPWNPVEQLIVEITAPFQRLIRQSIDATKNFWMNYFYLVDVRSENARLKQAVDALRRENNRYRELLATHERLRQLLRFKEMVQRPATAARVIGVDPTGWFKSIIIDKGKGAGLSWDMPVVNASGVVGRIVSVSKNYAKVLLIVDQNSAVDCLTQRSRDRGMVKGTGGRLCEMDYMAKSGDVAVGDLVVTSGLGGVFPKGLPVGTVTEAKDEHGKLFKEIDIMPCVDFSKLEEVLVIQGADRRSEDAE